MHSKGWCSMLRRLSASAGSKPADFEQLRGEDSPEVIALRERLKQVELLLASSQQNHQNDVFKLQRRLERAEDAKHDELEAVNSQLEQALESVGTYKTQQQRLFDEFVLLRNRYDTLKGSTTELLWERLPEMGHFSKGIIPPVSQTPDKAGSEAAGRPKRSSSDSVSVDSSSSLAPAVEEVGGYSFGPLLGDGNNATVRSCHRIDSPDVQLAVKVIAKGRITSLSAFNRVVAEVKGLQKLSHPGILVLHEVIHAPQHLYLVTEKGGIDLFDFLDTVPINSQGRIDDDLAQTILAGIVAPVAHCHANNICHRDLKPENILLKVHREGPDPRSVRVSDIKLCDFGLCSSVDEGTLLHDFCGSPGFFAPEIVIDKGQGYNGMSVDMWGVGCILLELRLGHKQFNTEWMRVYDYKGYSRPTKFRRRIQEGLHNVLRLLVEMNASALQRKEAATETALAETGGSESELQKAQDLDANLLSQLLELDPEARMLATDAMRHPWLGSLAARPSRSAGSTSPEGRELRERAMQEDQLPSTSSEESVSSTPTMETRSVDTRSVRRPSPRTSDDSALNAELPFGGPNAGADRRSEGEGEGEGEALAVKRRGGGESASQPAEKALPPLSHRSPNLVLRNIGDLEVKVDRTMAGGSAVRARCDDASPTSTTPKSDQTPRSCGVGGFDDYSEITMSKREREKFTVNHMPPVEPATPDMRSARKGLKMLAASSSQRAEGSAAAEGNAKRSLTELNDGSSASSTGYSYDAIGPAPDNANGDPAPTSPVERKRSIADPSNFPGSAVATNPIREEGSWRSSRTNDSLGDERNSRSTANSLRDEHEQNAINAIRALRDEHEQNRVPNPGFAMPALA